MAQALSNVKSNKQTIKIQLLWKQ